MRIAYIINSVEGGGAAFPVPAVAAALRSHGVDVEIFALTRRDGRAIPAMADAGLSVHVRDGGETDHWAAYRWLRPMLGQYKPDAVWTSLTRATLLGQVAAAAQRIPVISWQHAAYLRAANRRLLRLRRNQSALWLADSCSVADFSRKALGIPTDRLVVWPIFAADPDAPVAAPWTGQEPLRIGTLGRLHPVKGYDVLLAAIKILRQRNPAPRAFELTIGGTGAEHGTLQAQILEAGLDDVTLAGFVGDPTAFLANQHLYVQPSRSEGFCIAAHQAMQAGLPVIGSAVGEMSRSIVDGVTGRLAIPGNPVSLASAIFESLEHAADLHRMGFSARRRLFEHYSRDRFNQIAGEILRRLDDLSRQVR
jgi:glycosyltransferase involved in cell wall biosynthesis